MFTVTPPSPLFMANPAPASINFTPPPTPIVPFASAAPAVSPAAITSPSVSAGSSFNLSLLNNSLNLLSSGIAAFSQLQVSRAQQRTAEFEANMLQIKAQQESIKARQEAVLLRKKVQKDLGKARAMFAGRGIRLGEGSALQALEESIKEESEAIDTLTFGAERKSSELNFAADIKRAEGRVARGMGLFGVGNTLRQSLLAFNPPS